jgi:hypothetical protein
MANLDAPFQTGSTSFAFWYTNHENRELLGTKTENSRWRLIDDFTDWCDGTCYFLSWYLHLGAFVSARL